LDSTTRPKAAAPAAVTSTGYRGKQGQRGEDVKRVAIVTGAGRGIGEATARALARDGHAVALADLNVAEAGRIASSLAGDDHDAFSVDVADEHAVEALFDAVETQLGAVAVLACVAGGPFLTPGRRPSIVETTTDNWIRTEALNARGPFLCIRAMLRRRMRNPVEDGRIITVSSMSGITPESPTGPAYSAAKAAVIHLTRYAALEAAPLGITVNTVAPGLTDTPAVRGDLTVEQIEAARRTIPIGRLGKPEDIAETIAFLASARAGYITGAVIEANGGRQPP
jgi:NAD(P)-dependent dehydrogenase (short-subunit alcohol dehydrogenase family)